jgi:putative aminopeptidase FrvX
MRGAMVAANRVLPDAALVFETTAALDCPGVEPPRRLLTIGRGPAMRIMDQSVITQMEMLDFMKDMAKANGIPYQLHISLGAANEAGPIHLSGRGVPTGVLSTPCRYLHGPALMLSMDDLILLPRLAEAVIRGIEKTDQFAFKFV